MDIAKYELSADELRWQCDPSSFEFKSTKDVPPLREFVGQDRAIRSIEFGLDMNLDGYNIYVAGLTGTGKTTAVKTHIDKLLKEKQSREQIHPPLDWCYIHNFTDADQPQIISLPQGKSRVFRDQMLSLMQKLKEELPKAFSSEEYKAERKKATESGQLEQQHLIEEMEGEAQRQGFSIQITPMGRALIPLANGKPLSQEDYQALDESDRKELEARRAELFKKLQSIFEKGKEIERETAEKLQETDKSIAGSSVSRLIDPLAQEYANVEKISHYLTTLRSYILNNLDLFKEIEEQPQPILGVPASYIMRGRDPFLPFHINVFVDNGETKGTPVVIESNPNYVNLFGKIERRFLLGGYISDHTMLKPGGFHLANGGYLLLNAADVLTNPGTWPAVKRAMKTKVVRIEDPFEQIGLVAPQGLRPQPMPISIKVILIGDTKLYQLLSQFDEDFWEIFKVKAEFDFHVDRTKENMMAYAAFIASTCQLNNLHHFDQTGVAKTVEYAARIVADQKKLSSRFALIRELVQEAEHWARKDNATLVSALHVERAVEERIFRHNLIDEQIGELIENGTIMIDIEGAVVGQVNGLTIYSLGDVTFGKPARITCKTFLGRGGIINIERESQLSGKIHDKGVLILSGYLGWKYAQDNPLSLSASLCFEQSYDGVEGDSASSAELYTILSSLSDIPIRQDIAVTGSVNQKGEIQPIGGVNQKIEGFFQVCKAKELTGRQGVVIPLKNARNLMLRQEVVDAVRQGKFHIYAVETVDQGIEIITSIEAGHKREDGTYPEGSINHKVDKRLREMATKLSQFRNTADEEREKHPRKKRPPLDS